MNLETIDLFNESKEFIGLAENIIKLESQFIDTIHDGKNWVEGEELANLMFFQLEKFIDILNLEKNKNTKRIRIFKRQQTKKSCEEVNKNIDKLSQYLSSIDWIDSFIKFKVATTFIAFDKVKVSSLLKEISTDWENYYAVKVLLLYLNENVYNFCERLKYSDLLREKSIDIVAKFSESFHDYQLIKDISSIKSNNIQILFFLLQRVVDIILNLLYVDFSNDERKVAHYTSLFGFSKIVRENEFMRLNSADLMNDPSEGNLIFSYLGIDNHSFDNSFLTCFTFNHNSLNQFRLYGRTNNKEGTGVSLVFDKTYFSSETKGFVYEKLIGNVYSIGENLDNQQRKLPLFRCIYMEPKTNFFQVAQRSKVSFYQEYAEKLEIEAIEDKYNTYSDNLKKIEKDLEINFALLKRLTSDIISNSTKLKNKNINNYIQRSIRPLKYLFKHIAFREEQECRMFYITGITDPNLIIPNGEENVVFRYKHSVKDALRNIYIGPASSDKLTYIKKVVSDVEKISVNVCDSPFNNK